jgi:DOPA 4,5-dioxygenase
VAKREVKQRLQEGEGMTETPREAGTISECHAHIYYDPDDPDSRARYAVARMGGGTISGAHPTAMYQIAFKRDVFAALTPFILLNRSGLTVLLHPESGRPRDDHTLHAAWMGEILPLKTEVLREVDEGQRQLLSPCGKGVAGRLKAPWVCVVHFHEEGYHLLKLCSALLRRFFSAGLTTPFRPVSMPPRYSAWAQRAAVASS